MSTGDLARAIGVSESSIKRWADEGVIRATRTAGGHRRIPTSEAVRFIRESHIAVVRPEFLGLPEAGTPTGTEPGADDDAALLTRFLLAGAAPEARGLIHSLYLSGRSVAAIADGPLRAAMARIGEMWRHDANGIFLEHRATDVCVQALNRLRTAFPEKPGAALALGGAPPGDPYLLPSLTAATALAAEGFRTINLGPETPFETLHRACRDMRPALVWLSVSTTTDPAALRGSIERFSRDVEPAGVSVVVGGRGLVGGTPTAENLHVGASIGELAAFARGLLASTAS
ncbi:MAG: MerR family DNA-binding transcriptional regulator [Acidobacteriota bacterium]